jgi:hypothetical protein
MNIEAAGVIPDRVRNRIPRAPSERGRGRGVAGGSAGCMTRG